MTNVPTLQRMGHQNRFLSANRQVKGLRLIGECDEAKMLIKRFGVETFGVHDQSINGNV